LAFKLLICLGSDAWVGSELRFKRIYQCSGYFWSCQPFEGFFFWGRLESNRIKGL